MNSGPSSTESATSQTKSSPTAELEALAKGKVFLQEHQIEPALKQVEQYGNIIQIVTETPMAQKYSFQVGAVKIEFGNFGQARKNLLAFLDKQMKSSRRIYNAAKAQQTQMEERIVEIRRMLGEAK